MRFQNPRYSAKLKPTVFFFSLLYDKAELNLDYLH